MTVTAIIAPISSKKKRNVFIDEGFAFSLYYTELKRYHIKEGEEISKEQYQQIMQECILKRAKLRALHLLEKRDYTVYEITDRLRKSDYDDNTIENVIDYLKGYRYLDDLRYSKQYIRYKKETLNQFQIKQKLMQKGINKDVFTKAFLEIEAEEDFDFSSQEEKLIHSLIEKKIKSYSDIQAMDDKAWNKIYQFLARRGYTSAQITTAIRSFRN